MKKYKVHLSDDIYYTIEVTAKDEDEAINNSSNISVDVFFFIFVPQHFQFDNL